jgi:hypothetical protein
MRLLRIHAGSLLTIICFSILAITVASAQQTWWIQSADYGAGRQRQDVTNTLKRLVNNGPNFKVTNANMGTNPAPGQNKSLRIVARDSGGNVRDFNYKEGAIVNSSMFSGGPNTGRPGWTKPQPWWGNQPGFGNNRPGWNNNAGLNIVSAKWGAGRQWQDVTSRVQSYVRNNRISVKVTPQNMGGDPAQGVSKTLTVVYQYQGRQNNTSLPEGAMLTLP